MSASVAWVSALIGLNVALPQSLSQISVRISELMGALKPAFDERLGKPLHALGFRPVRLANREAVALDHLHHARRDQFGGRIDHGADDPLRADIGGNLAVRVRRRDGPAFERTGKLMEIPPGQAVLERDHGGAGVEEARQVLGNRRHLMGLERQQHEIVGAGLADGSGGAGNLALRAVLLDEREAVLPDRLKVGPPRDERNLLARQRQPRPKQAANRASAYNRETHAVLPVPFASIVGRNGTPGASDLRRLTLARVRPEKREAVFR